MINLEKFKNELNLLLQNGEKKILLAVSGGVDSMVLLWLFANSFSQIAFRTTLEKKQRITNGDLPFQVAHINYHLRGEDSVKDQQLVEDFCQKYNIPYHIYQISDEDKKPKNGSIQMWARDLRYRFFNKILDAENIDYLATAHHLDDQLETFIINLSRGTGLNGLCGIPTNENQIIRPLLGFSKAEIYDFARENQIPFREDISNTKNDYLRNKIRNKISPLLKEINPDFLENFKKSIRYLKQNQEFTSRKIEEVFNDISKKKSGRILINKNQLNSENDFVKFEILRKFGFENMTEIRKIFSAEIGSIFKSKNYVLSVERDELFISEKIKIQNTGKEFFIPIEAIDTENQYYTINISEYFQLEFSEKKEEVSVFFDWDKVKFPLKLRRRKTGDELYPTGMQGKKKLSKYFKDEKFSSLRKDETWLLVDAEDEILWVIPNRQDRRCSPTEKTQNLLKITI